jgi:hypothetical protein
MTNVRPWCLLALAALPTGGCGRASPEECRAMRERYVDLATREAGGGKVLSAAQADAVREVERGLKRAEPTYRRVEDRCEEVTRSEMRCALGADTTRAWETCLRRAGDER